LASHGHFISIFLAIGIILIAYVVLLMFGRCNYPGVSTCVIPGLPLLLIIGIILIACSMIFLAWNKHKGKETKIFGVKI